MPFVRFLVRMYISFKIILQDYYERDVRAAHVRIAADARDSCLLLSQGGAISSSAGPHSVPGVLSGQVLMSQIIKFLDCIVLHNCMMGKAVNTASI